VSNNVYVGNLSYETSREQLLTLFASHGQVASVNVITDRATGRPRGFAFVDKAKPRAARADGHGSSRVRQSGTGRW
jgi:RNA recognition motif-containing protein